MNAFAGRLLAVTVVVLAICAGGCLAQERADGESEWEDIPPALALEAAAGQDADARVSPNEGEGAVSGEERPEYENADGPSAQGEALQRIRVSLSREVLLCGEQARAQAAFDPRQAGDPSVHWSSSDPRIADVDDGGVIWVLEGAQVPDEGVDVDIWARATDGSLAMDCATLRVMPAVRALNMLEDEVRLGADDFTAVAVEIEPESLVGVAAVEWVSSDDQVAWVSASGTGEVALVYAGAPGQATITACAQDGSGCADSLTVTVE